MHEPGSLSWAAFWAEKSEAIMTSALNLDYRWDGTALICTVNGELLHVTRSMLTGWTIKTPAQPVEGSRNWAIKMLQDGVGVPKWCNDSACEVGLSYDGTKLAWPPGETPSGRASIEKECYDSGWKLVKTPVPELPTHCIHCKRPFKSQPIRHEWQKDYCEECFERMLDERSEGAPEPETKDVMFFCQFEPRKNDAHRCGWEAEQAFMCRVVCYLFREGQDGCKEFNAPLAWRRASDGALLSSPELVPGEWRHAYLVRMKKEADDV